MNDKTEATQGDALKEFEFTSQSISRSEILIASFVGGYASGWAFPLPEPFKEALDIRQSEKKTAGLNRGYSVWTQGTSYSFKEGDLMHNSRLAYDNYIEFLRGQNPISIQVRQGVPSTNVIRESYEVLGSTIRVGRKLKSTTKEIYAEKFVVRKQVYEPGEITIVIYRPNEGRTAMDQFKEIDIEQDTLVGILQSGIWREIADSHLHTHDFNFNTAATR